MSEYGVRLSERLPVSKETKKRLLAFVRSNDEVKNADEAISFLLDFYRKHRREADV